MAQHDRGRPTSWLAAIVIIAGFAVGGLGLVVGRWWLFWVGIGICVVGGIVAIAVDMISDVELDPIHQDNAEPFKSLIRHTEVSESAERSTPSIVGQGPDVGEVSTAPDAATGTGDAADADADADTAGSTETSSTRS